MCGGFVVADTLRLNTGTNAPSVTFWQSLYPHLLYNFGRIITHAFLGFILGFIGESMGIILGIKNYQSGLEIFADIEILPIIGMFFFIALFIGIIIWVLRLNKKYIKKMKQLPLEKDDKPINGDSNNGKEV
jgi:sulfite exporter TauE/SafE